MSNKTDVLSFDKWFGEASQNKLFWESPSKASKMGFESGQQSKQSEIEELQKRVKELELINFDSELHFDAAKEHIDHLQKRLDEINNHLEINYDEDRDDDSHSYWSGYNQALRELFEILKGEETK